MILAKRTARGCEGEPTGKSGRILLPVALVMNPTRVEFGRQLEISDIL